MRDFIKQMTETFRAIQDVETLPSIKTINYLKAKIGNEINNVTLAEALGRANIKVQTTEQFELLVEEGLLDEYARMLVMLYHYSMDTFDTDEFFINSAGRMDLTLE